MNLPLIHEKPVEYRKSVYNAKVWSIPILSLVNKLVCTSTIEELIMVEEYH